MSQEMVTHRRHNGRWIGIGIALAVIGLASVITALILGNTWNEEGGTEHGALQGALLIGGAFVAGFGIVSIVIGFVKRAPSPGDRK